LHRLPIDVLKIDRSFVTGLSIDHEGRQIVATIVSLARHLGMKVVAEGTETVAHVEALRALGCDFGQGYVFAKAASAGPFATCCGRKRRNFIWVFDWFSWRGRTGGPVICSRSTASAAVVDFIA
jgi:EAL domain-containing protein (putative c-di-GMP-specific phosphodiesterase class I)